MKNVTIADLKMNIYLSVKTIMFVLIAWMAGYNAIKKMLHNYTSCTSRP